jgi:NADH dehydrogenase
MLAGRKIYGKIKAMERVVIIGGGFAGLSAAGILSRRGKGLEIVLVDRKNCFNFLPLLPDALGRGISPELMAYPLKNICSALRIRFIHDIAQTIAPDGKSVHLESGLNLDCDYLLLSCGTETNFYGNTLLSYFAHKLDNVSDALKLRQTLMTGCYDNYLIAGGGYTGIEIAGNLSLFLREKRRKSRIIIVEKGPAILGPLPEWMKAYVSKNLAELGVEVRTGLSINESRAGRSALSDGSIFGNSMVIWAAGVKTPDFIDRVPAQRTAQGRLKTDEFLRINRTCFAAGDNACFSSEPGCLRMSVQFAIKQGEACARNILKGVNSLPPVKFRPVDPGYIIPMTNDRACGIILGRPLKGILPLFLHYLLCVYRSRGLKNRARLALLLLKKATR